MEANAAREQIPAKKQISQATAHRPTGSHGKPGLPFLLRFR
jgi:hypothetical protein